MKELKLYEIMYNNGDIDEFEEEQSTGDFFEKLEDAINFLKNQADIIVDTIEQLNRYDFNKLEKEFVNIFIKCNEFHRGDSSSLYSHISVIDLKNEKDETLRYVDYKYVDDVPSKITIR